MRRKQNWKFNYWYVTVVGNFCLFWLSLRFLINPIEQYEPQSSVSKTILGKSFFLKLFLDKITMWDLKSFGKTSVTKTWNIWEWKRCRVLLLSIRAFIKARNHLIAHLIMLNIFCFQLNKNCGPLIWILHFSKWMCINFFCNGTKLDWRKGSR